MGGLVIVGDQAFTPEEWAAEQRRRAQAAAYMREYRKRPGFRERRIAYMREWRDRNREALRAYHREWKRARRAA